VDKAAAHPESAILLLSEIMCNKSKNVATYIYMIRYNEGEKAMLENVIEYVPERYRNDLKRAIKNT